jgi:DNA-binding response OmpR family regulator
MKVLVVHPNEAVVADIKARFGHWIFRSAISGLDGLLACRTEYFDLILCGLDLPVVTGIEMVRSLRNISENRETSVLFLADGKETEEHFRIIHKMNARLVTIDQLKEVNFLLDGKITT